MTGWVPVTERLPEPVDEEEAQQCWVTVLTREGPDVFRGYMSHVGWRYVHGHRINRPVLAWMPIIKPEAYEP